MSEPSPNALSILPSETQRTLRTPALLADGAEIGYDQLWSRVDRMAEHLQRKGAQAGRTVAICLERSPELIFGVLGILKAGAAYVPVDPTYPQERITGMLEDAQPPVILTDRAHAQLFADFGATILLIEDVDLVNGPAFPGASPAKADDPLYVLFTSGSTGRPKGVSMHHAPLLNLIQWQLRTSVCKSGDRTLQFAPISFDVSFQEIFTTFAQGGTLVLITDEDRLNSTRLLRKVR